MHLFILFVFFYFLLIYFLFVSISPVWSMRFCLLVGGKRSYFIPFLNYCFFFLMERSNLCIPLFILFSFIFRIIFLFCFVFSSIMAMRFCSPCGEEENAVSETKNYHVFIFFCCFFSFFILVWKDRNIFFYICEYYGK